MSQKTSDKRKKLLQCFTLWHPLFFLLAMFLLGACARTFDSDVPEPSAMLSESFSPERGNLVTAEPVPFCTTSPYVEETHTLPSGIEVKEAGNYTSKEEVALYLHLYGRLPSNYITARSAKERGWVPEQGTLDSCLPGLSIGGSAFGNYEGLLPEKRGRKYYECDIDYAGGYRNAKRIVYSDDGLIFYTEDHYQSFERLY